MKKAEKEYQQRLRDLGCVVCRVYLGVFTIPSIHHIRPMGARNVSEFDVLPLCYHHHQGVLGFHSEPELFAREFGSEEELRCEVQSLLEVSHGRGKL